MEKFKFLTEDEMYNIEGGWSWQGAISGCGTSVMSAVELAPASFYFAPPQLKAGYLGGVCLVGAFFGGQG